VRFTYTKAIAIDLGFRIQKAGQLDNALDFSVTALKHKTRPVLCCCECRFLLELHCIWMQWNTFCRALMLLHMNFMSFASLQRFLC